VLAAAVAGAGSKGKAAESSSESESESESEEEVAKVAKVEPERTGLTDSSSESESEEEAETDKGKKAPVPETKAEEKKAADKADKGKKEEIAVGHWVRIEGLVQTVAMNGRTGVVKRRHGAPATGHWMVMVDGKTFPFAEKNLRLERVEVED
jgi:hypothetical protein